MAKVTMRLEGFDATLRALQRAPELVRVLASDAVAKSTFAVAQRARALVPVDTGRLKDAIDSSRTVTGLSGSVGVNKSAPVGYWRYVEFGTSRMSARPFFRPAAESERNPFIQRFRDIGSRLERDWTAGGRS